MTSTHGVPEFDMSALYVTHTPRRKPRNRRSHYAALALAVATIAAPTAALGQSAGCLAVYGTPFEAVVSPRGLVTAGEPSRLLQSGSKAITQRGCAPFLERNTMPGSGLLPVAVQSSFRSAYPFDRNNGALWNGRGVNQAVSLGGRVAIGPVRLTAYPTFAFQQNRAFAIAPSFFAGSPLRYPYLLLDWPQRFGEASFWTVDPGQTALHLLAGPLEISAGTESLRWGPAERYPILLSTTGPGFPHARAGLGPVWIGVGELEVGVLWGRLDESDYFDAEAVNDLRLFTLLTAGYRPWFLPGLALGLAYARHAHWKGLEGAFGAPFKLSQDEDQSGEATTNGLLSAVLDWTLAEADFRVYAEWAREDYWLNFEDLVTQPDHGQGYLLGLEKRFGATDRPWRLRWELAHLGEADTQSARNQPTFYAHRRVTQGHTHRGQLLGAAIGPGSNAQFLALDAVSGSRILGGYLERARFDDDTYEARFTRDYGFHGHDLEVTLGFYGLEGIGPVTLQWDVGVSRRKNRNFIGLDGISWDFRRETNLGVSLTAWWSPIPPD